MGKAKVNGEGERDALPSLASISSFIAVAGAIIYLIGLGALVIPLRRDLLGDLATAYFAASLAPRTSIAWQGVAGLLLPSLIIASLIVGLYYVPSLLDYLLRREWVLLLTLLLVGLPLVLVALIVGVINTVFFTPSLIRQEYPWWCLLIAAMSIVGAAVTGLLAVRQMNQVNAGSRSNLRIKAILLIFGTAFLVALPYPVLKPLTLPSVELNGLSTVQGASVTQGAGSTETEDRFSEGALLVNAEGGWYVLSLHPNSKSTVVFIPNSRVEKACVWDANTPHRVTNRRSDC